MLWICFVLKEQLWEDLLLSDLWLLSKIYPDLAWGRFHYYSEKYQGLVDFQSSTLCSFHRVSRYSATSVEAMCGQIFSVVLADENLNFSKSFIFIELSGEDAKCHLSVGLLLLRFFGSLCID